MADAATGFFGRREERALFDGVLQTARAGRLQALLLSGAPGIGKTRLAAELASSAENAGFLPLPGSWREDVELPEYWAWRQLLRRLLQAHGLARPGLGLDSALSELSAIIPELRDERPGLAPPLSDAGAPSRLRLLDAACRLLRRAADRQPLLLLLDNLHLAGAASLELITGQMEELADLPLLLIGAFRDLPATLKEPFLSFLGIMRQRPAVRECRLDNLAPADAAALLESELGRPPGEALLEEVLGLTQGHPLFVKEAGRLCHGRLGAGGRPQERICAEELPRAVGSTVALRFGRLPADAREALSTAAVVGESFTLEELRMAAERPGSGRAGTGLEEALEEAAAHGFLERVDGAGEYRFSHAVVHESIRLAVSAAWRRQTCARLAAAVERAHAANLSARALRLAGWWAEAGGAEGAANARRCTRLAAEAALEAGAWEQAIGLYGRLIAPGDGVAACEGEAELLLGLGRACFQSGERIVAFQHLRRAFAWFRSHGRMERLIQIATLPGYLHSGDPGFFDLIGEVLEALPPGSPALGLVLLSQGVVQFNNRGDYAGADETLRRAEEIGSCSGDRRLQATCLIARAFVDSRLWRLEAARRKLDQAEPLLEGSTDTYAVSHYNILRSQDHVDGGRPGEAVPFLDRWIDIAVRSRDAFAVGASHFSRSRIDLLAGDWGSARRFIDAGLSAAPDHLFLLSGRANLEYTVGDFAEGDRFRERLLAVHRRTPPGPYTAHLHAVSTAVVRARQSGDSRDLARHLPALQTMAGDPGAHPFILFRARLLLAFAAALIGDAEGARRAHRGVQGLPPLYMVHPYHTERILGLAAHAYGDHPSAAAHLREALRWARHYGDRPLEAWILCELGEVLASPAGEAEPPAEARRPLLESLEAARRLGMPPLAERAREKLEELSRLLEGGRPAHAHLSRREKQVLALVVEGLTNEAIAGRLAISGYTAANHVRRILQRTGAANRTEAAALARRLGLVD